MCAYLAIVDEKYAGIVSGSVAICGIGANCDGTRAGKAPSTGRIVLSVSHFGRGGLS